MRRVVVGFGIVAFALAGCSKAPDGSDVGPQIGNASAGGLAFTYAYSLTLPARAIDDVQEEHAAACEALGPMRCRITGLAYTVDHAGNVSASLSARVATPLARRFGRDAIAAAERAGATLTGAEIGGMDTVPDEVSTATQQADAHSDLTRIDRELARSDLPAAERATLQAQRADRLTDLRNAAAAGNGTRASVAMAPVSLTYITGRGAGFVNRLREAGDTALASAATTLTALLWLIATLGPPLAGLLVLFVLWDRVGRPLWARLTGSLRHDSA